MDYDIKSNLQVNAAQIENVTGNGTVTGGILDTADFDLGVMFALMALNFTDGVHTLLIEESDDSGMAGATVVAGDQLIGTLPAATAATAEGAKVGTVGVISHKRYLRSSVVSTGVTTGSDVVVSSVMKGENLPIA